DYRVYAKYFNRSSLVDGTGLEAADQWDLLHGGFRADWNASEKDVITLQGEIYRGDAGQTLARASLLPPLKVVADSRIKTTGGNLLGRWTRVLSPRSELALQLYYD